jgi:hypothetical protein
MSVDLLHHRLSDPLTNLPTDLISIIATYTRPYENALASIIADGEDRCVLHRADWHADLVAYAILTRDLPLADVLWSMKIGEAVGDWFRGVITIDDPVAPLEGKVHHTWPIWSLSHYFDALKEIADRRLAAGV